MFKITVVSEIVIRVLVMRAAWAAGSSGLRGMILTLSDLLL